MDFQNPETQGIGNDYPETYRGGTRSNAIGIDLRIFGFLTPPAEDVLTPVLVFFTTQPCRTKCPTWVLGVCFAILRLASKYYPELPIEPRLIPNLPAFNHDQSNDAEAEYDRLRGLARQEASKRGSCFHQVGIRDPPYSGTGRSAGRARNRTDLALF